VTVAVGAHRGEGDHQLHGAHASMSVCVQRECSMHTQGLQLEGCDWGESMTSCMHVQHEHMGAVNQGVNIIRTEVGEGRAGEKANTNN
jgi:hypothetical protein